MSTADRTPHGHIAGMPYYRVTGQQVPWRKVLAEGEWDGQPFNISVSEGVVILEHSGEAYILDLREVAAAMLEAAERDRANPNVGQDVFERTECPSCGVVDVVQTAGGGFICGMCGTIFDAGGGE